MSKQIYLDNNSTTPIDPIVFGEFFKVSKETFGNPSSRHEAGYAARALVETAREKVAKFINAKSRQVYFNSGATEGLNQIIREILPSLSGDEEKHIITTTIEHDGVLEPVKDLEKKGFEVTYLEPNAAGVIQPEKLKKAIKENTLAFVVIAAHNEFGTVQPLADLGKVCNEARVVFAIDAAQAIAKIPMDVEKIGCDFLVASAHKFYAPKGVGFSFFKKRPKDPENSSLLKGGGQEHGVRSGTVNAPAIHAVGVAIDQASKLMAAESSRLTEMRQLAIAELKGKIPNIQVNGSLETRIPGNLSLTFPGIDANAILNLMNDYSFSTGSACSADSVKPSRALMALGLSEDEALSSIRLCIGRFNTLEEVRSFCSDLISHVKVLQNAAF